MDCSSSTVSNTRPAPKAASSPLVTPYTPPLRATSSPNTSMPGRAASASVSVALMVWARVIGPADSGSRPPNARCRAAAPAGRGGRAAATASGQRGASGAITWAALVSRGAPASSRGQSEDRGPGCLVPVEHFGRGEQAGLDEQPGGADQRVGGQVRGDLARAAGTRSRGPAPACPPSRTMDRCRNAGERRCRTQAAAASVVSKTSARSAPSAWK